MSVLRPTSASELATVLRDAAESSKTITLNGSNSKRLMSGPIQAADISISTTALNKVLQYESNDLTVSVEAGLPFTKLQELLRKNNQMIALDPPFSEEATVGGILATNSNGPMRRGYGTARDLVIGTSFATLEGKIIKSGGMVVKNVAGLDMGKLLIGSFGTLAAITSVNFRIHSLPERTQTFLFAAPKLDEIIERRRQVLQSVLKPMAVDLMSESVATNGQRGRWVLAVRAGGTHTVLGRYKRELSGAHVLSEQEETDYWRGIREFTPSFLKNHKQGIVIRIGTKLSDIGTLFSMLSVPCIARGASGVSYAYFDSWQATLPLLNAAGERGWNVVVEFAPDEIRSSQALWTPTTLSYASNSFAMMEKVKHMFDPKNLLNRSRLYGRI